MEIPELIACCGLICEKCPIHLATIEPDAARKMEQRIQIAKFISEHYKTAQKPEDITDCDGCGTQSGRLFSGCCKCEIRKCAQKNGYRTCAQCSEFPCDHLQKFFVNDPDAKSRLEEIRNFN